MSKMDELDRSPDLQGDPDTVADSNDLYPHPASKCRPDKCGATPDPRDAPSKYSERNIGGIGGGNSGCSDDYLTQSRFADPRTSPTSRAEQALADILAEARNWGLPVLLAWAREEYQKPSDHCDCFARMITKIEAMLS